MHLRRIDVRTSQRKSKLLLTNLNKIKKEYINQKSKKPHSTTLKSFTIQETFLLNILIIIL